MAYKLTPKPAKPGARIPPGRGNASGSFVGTGVNRKTGATPQYQGSQPRSGVDSQAETWLNQAAAPFDNSQPSSYPRNFQSGPEGATFQKGAGIVGHSVPSQSAINTATGHDAGYAPRGQSSSPLTSGKPRKTNNTDNGGQPVVKKAQNMRTNRDLFIDAYEAYKRHGG